jgi:hypothetical protein
MITGIIIVPRPRKSSLTLARIALSIIWKDIERLNSRYKRIVLSGISQTVLSSADTKLKKYGSRVTKSTQFINDLKNFFLLGQNKTRMKNSSVKLTEDISKILSSMYILL